MEAPGNNTKGSVYVLYTMRIMMIKGSNHCDNDELDNTTRINIRDDICNIKSNGNKINRIC